MDYAFGLVRLPTLRETMIPRAPRPFLRPSLARGSTVSRSVTRARPCQYATPRTAGGTHCVCDRSVPNQHLQSVPVRFDHCPGPEGEGGRAAAAAIVS